MKKTLIAMVNYPDQFDIKTVIGSGKVLWQGRNGFEWIGPDDEKWKDVYIIQYSDSKIQSAIDRFNNAPLTQLNLLAVKPLSSIKIKSLQLMMRYFFSILPIKLTSDDKIDVEERLGSLKSPILPSSKQFSSLFDDNQEQNPVAMLNLLKYHSTAEYPLDFTGKKEKTGGAAYNQYGKQVMRVVAKLGGYIEHMGKVEGSITNDNASLWDEYAIMRYPNRTALRTMLSLKERGKGATKIHRDAGLAKTKVIALNSAELKT
jgi:hypothetical protein